MTLHIDPFFSIPIRSLRGRHYLCFHLWCSERLNNLSHRPTSGGARFAFQNHMSPHFPLSQPGRRIDAESSSKSPVNELIFRDVDLQRQSVTYHPLFSPMPTKERVAARPLAKWSPHTWSHSSLTVTLWDTGQARHPRHFTEKETVAQRDIIGCPRPTQDL